jgi:hypothetical protein
VKTALSVSRIPNTSKFSEAFDETLSSPRTELQHDTASNSFVILVIGDFYGYHETVF